MKDELLHGTITPLIEQAESSKYHNSEVTYKREGNIVTVSCVLTISNINKAGDATTKKGN